MTVEESLRRFGLVPSDAHLFEIREVLAAEAAAERSGTRSPGDLALLCCAQLFARGYAEDSLRVWQAKSAGFHLGCCLDAKLMCGAGVDRTLAFLEAHRSRNAAQARRYMHTTILGGNLRGFDPADYLGQLKRYFGRA